MTGGRQLKNGELSGQYSHMPHLDSASQARLYALANAPLDRWIALSADETRVVAEGESFSDVADKLDRLGDTDALILRVPDDWISRIL
jgi:hypothetical protein